MTQSTLCSSVGEAWAKRTQGCVNLPGWGGMGVQSASLPQQASSKSLAS